MPRLDSQSSFGIDLPPASPKRPLQPSCLAAVVLVHYGQPGFTARCLHALAAVETMPHRAIVVNHGPSADLAQAWEGIHPNLEIISNLSNPGFAAGCNLGAAQAFRMGARWVWFLNNDATLDHPVLENLTSLAQNHPQVALWGTFQKEGDRLLGSDRHPRWLGEGLDSPHCKELPPGCTLLQPREALSGASILISHEQWERLGPWPEDCFLYLEDTAWCRRAQGMGLPVVLTNLYVVHQRSATIGKRSPLSIFYGVRNTLRLHRFLHPKRNLTRLGMAFHLIQKRFFQGRWSLLPHTWRGILAAWNDQGGRDPRY